jgi:hypothetical protein
LPENHDCPALGEWNDPDGVFDSGFDDSVENQGGTSKASKLINKVSSTGGPLGYFRGNAAYAFLGLMWITFLLEWVVIGLFGQDTFNAIFTITTANPAYVWTWIISIFSHSPAGLFHIASNSIVLFFFGPLVERYTGSRKFALLFIGAGMLAGLGQIGVSILLDNPAAVLGASGAVFAVLGVLTVLKPKLKVLLFFVVPVPLYILTFGFALISVVFFVNPGAASATGMGNVANFAHLVGLLVGLWYGRQLKGEVRLPNQIQLGGGGPGGPGGPGRGRF